jgi:CBS-domain-containing membrane protein
LTHVDVLVQNLLVNKVHSPDADTVVVDSDEFLVGVVVESDLVGNVHANTVSDNSFARLDFPNDKLVVVLSAKRSQELLVLGEVEILDEHFVQLEAVQHRHCVEVPNDDISLESHVGLLARCDVLACV